MADLIALGLVLVALVFILAPLIQRQSKSLLAGDQSEKNTELFREQVSAFEQQLGRGEIDQQQFDELRVEQQRLLLIDNTEADPLVQNNPDKGKWLMLVVALVVLPAAAFSLYKLLGAAPDMEISDLLKTGKNARTEAQYLATRTEVTTLIEQRLLQKPQHAGYQIILAQLSMESGDYRRAADLYRQSVETFPEDSSLIAEYAQAEYFAENNQFNPNIELAIEKSLAIDADNGVALGLRGIKAFQKEDYRQAIASWQHAMRAVRQGSPQALALQSGIAAASEALGEPLPGINVDVSLSPSLTLSPEQTLYVYARELGSNSPPLAVIKLQASALPAVVRLDDSAMMPGGKPLSSASQIEVVARISSSGNAGPSAGDLEGKSGVIELDGNEKLVSLMIDRVIPDFKPSASVITAEVSLSGELQSSPEQVLYVYAREKGGSRMPLAIARLTAADLPTTVQLDDSMAMPGGRPLSSAKQVEVVARISLSGAATAASGDLIGVSDAIEPGSEPLQVSVFIEKIIP